MHKLSIIGVCEPKLSMCDTDSIWMRLNFDHVVCNPSGDLWVFFSFPFISQVIGNLDQHLSILLGHLQFLCSFLVSFVQAKCTSFEMENL